MVFNFGIFIPHDSPSLLDHNPVTKLIFENFPYADEAKKPFCEKWVNSDRPKKSYSSFISSGYNCNQCPIIPQSILFAGRLKRFLGFFSLKFCVTFLSNHRRFQIRDSEKCRKCLISSYLATNRKTDNKGVSQSPYFEFKFQRKDHEKRIREE